MEQTNADREEGERVPSEVFQFLHNTLCFYDTLESPAGPIKAEVKGWFDRGKKKLNPSNH